jgi:hypothetical protein
MSGAITTERRSRFRLRLLQSATLASVALVAACGDGGGGGVHTTPPPPSTPTPTPVPAPSPSPTPAPTPTPSSYDTAEYRATVGAVSANALAAYNVGATGKGIDVGIVDSGIDAGTTDFGNRISPVSQDVASNRPLDDEGGHGTAVAFTLAGNRNGTGTQGFAFDSTLIIARADTPGTCATTTSDGESGCSFNDTAIAKGIDLAANNGARVINISLGGDAAGQSVVDAIGRATAKGVIVVIAAGNDFATDPTNAVNPDAFAQVANLAQANGLVIVAGSVGANNNRTAGADAISSFSNRAGNTANHFLTAVGEDVRAPCDNTSVCLWTGTSLAAPQISGAIALLAQAFPNLTAAQIVQVLFDSARDAGAPGVDPVYGEGVLDLTKAFSPLGTTSVAGTATPMSLSVNGTLSAPMGDAGKSGLGAVILDSFNRAFAIDLARTLNRSGPERTLIGMLQSQNRSFSSSVGGTSVAMTIASTPLGITVSPTQLGFSDAQMARTVAGSVVQRMGSTTQFAFGFSQDSGTLTAQMTGLAQPAFLVARDPLTSAGFDSRINGSQAVRQQFGRLGVTAAFETGEVLSPQSSALPAADERWFGYRYSRGSVAFDRRWGGLALGVSGSWLGERNTVLGAHFNQALGAGGAGSWFLDATARFEWGNGWSVGGSFRRGWTFATMHGALADGGRIETEAFAADVGKDDTFQHGDSIGLRIAQPLRVSNGGLDFTLPTNYDYATLAVTDWTTQRLDLTPTGREVDAELRYAFPFWSGLVETNLFWRHNPGNFADLPADAGAALRWSRNF